MTNINGWYCRLLNTDQIIAVVWLYVGTARLGLFLGRESIKLFVSSYSIYLNFFNKYIKHVFEINFTFILIVALGFDLVAVMTDDAMLY